MKKALSRLPLAPLWLASALTCAVAIAAPGSKPLPGASPSPISRREIRFLVPNPPLPGAQRELQALVDRYNALIQSPSARVRLVRRGEDFSALRDLMALHLAGDTPELALIECSELSAIERSGLAQPFVRLGKLGAPSSAVAAAHLHESRDFKGRVISLPFQHTMPVWVANTAMLTRAGLPEQLPDTWKKAVETVNALGRDAAKAAAESRYAIALPLQGGRGLWIFEALADRPLWKREVGGIRANRDLDDPVRQLQAWVDSKTLGRSELNWDRALQDFVDQKAAVLVTSLDTLPILARQASFKWSAAPLPRIGQTAPSRSILEHGSHVIMTRDLPEVQEFLGYLYSTPVAKRWTSASGFLPLRPELGPGADYFRLASSGTPDRPRSTDPEIVRVRSEWIQALHFLFGEPMRRLDLTTVLRQLDTRLSDARP